MSYWVSLEDHQAEPWCDFGKPDSECPEPCYRTLTSEPFEDGGTYALGGSTECTLNVTYNYGRQIWEQLGEGGLRSLDGLTGEATIARLERAVAILGTERDADYWKSTNGNAGAALARLLAWARTYPHGIWRVN